MGNTFISSKEKDRNKNNKKSRKYDQSNRDLQNRVDKAFHKGGSKAVRQLLEDADVEYDMSTSILNGIEGAADGGNSEYTIQEGFSQGSSEISVATWISTHQEGQIRVPDDKEDIVTFHIAQTLNDVKKTWGSAKFVDDIIGVTWDGDNWELVGEPKVKATSPHRGYFYSESYRDEGVVAKVDLQTNNWLGYIEDKKCVVTLSGTVEYIGDNVTPIMGYYKHLEGLSGLDYIKSINIDAGAISVELSDHGSTLWDMADFSDPDGTTYL